MRPVAIAILTVCVLNGALTNATWAQPGATGHVASLNAEAKRLVDIDPDRSLAVAQQAAAAARERNDTRGEAEALNYVAYGYRSQSLLDLARRHARESVRLYVDAKDGWGEAQGYNALGLIEADDGKFTEALEYHLKALAIRERDGDKEGLSYSYNNLGNVFRNMAEYDKALEYHTRGLTLKIELGNKSSEAYSHHNIGLVYFAMGDYPNALAAYRRGLEIRERLNDPRAIGVSLNAIGSVEARTNPDAALRTYQRALVLRRETGDTRGEMATELNIGEVYRRTGDLVRATAAFDRALALGDRLDAPLMRSTAFKALSEVEAARGNFAAAYQRQLQHLDARDKMFNIENAARFQRLQVAHDAERQQRQIDVLQQQTAMRDAELAHTKTTRTALGVIVLLMVMSCVLLYGRLRLVERVQTLSGLLPICAWCKKVRDDAGYWTQIERYIASRSKAEFTHCICPSCFDQTSASDKAGHTEPRTA